MSQEQKTAFRGFLVVGSLHKQYINGAITKEEFMVRTAPILENLRRLESQQTPVITAFAG